MGEVWIFSGSTQQTILQLSAQCPGLCMAARLQLTLFWYRPHCFCCVEQVVLMLTRCIYMTKAVRSIKTRSTLASLPYKGQVTKQTTVKWSIRSRKKINLTDSTSCGGSDEKIPPAPATNQIARFVEFRPLTSWEKDKYWLLILKAEGQTIYRKPQRKVTKLKSKFCLFLSYLALNSPAQELRF